MPMRAVYLVGHVRVCAPTALLPSRFLQSITVRILGKAGIDECQQRGQWRQDDAERYRFSGLCNHVSRPDPNDRMSEGTPHHHGSTQPKEPPTLGSTAQREIEGLRIKLQSP